MVKYSVAILVFCAVLASCSAQTPSSSQGSQGNIRRLSVFYLLLESLVLDGYGEVLWLSSPISSNTPIN